MSLQTAFKNGKTALRRGTYGVALAASLFGANAGHAADFTSDECTSIAGIATDVVSVLGPERLSEAFMQSFGKFVMPADKMDCSGPTDIQTPQAKDVDAYNDIRLIAGSGKHPIDLQKRGLRAVTSVALNQPLAEASPQ